ncbi:MAG TPA: OmpA family protein [Polyangia bacterium]|jgi:outer membrane protein OmpA-like peptidoglycan-associated protein|nr:OmpA family protein [Polyangia bacterium]
MWIKGRDTSRFSWTDAQKEQYRRNFIAQVEARWTDQHTMNSTKPCWEEFVAHPHIHVMTVADKAQAHFHVQVHKVSGLNGPIEYKSGVNNEHLSDPTQQPTADFYQSDNTEEPDFNSGSVATAERTRIENALGTSGANPVLFDQDSSMVPAAKKSQLEAFARALVQANPSAPLIPVNVDGYASADGDAAHNQQLSRLRADAVRAVLAAAGPRQPLRAAGKGPAGAANDPAQRKVELSVDHTFETTYRSNRYSVSEHEFGHMLGNPDEYSNATAPGGSPLLAGAQQRWTALVQSAGLSAPMFGQDTSSQMSNGVDVLPSHYITLWEALGRMTQPDITQAQWKLS